MATVNNNSNADVEFRNNSSSFISKTRSIQNFLQFKKRRIRSEHKVRTLCSRLVLANQRWVESNEQLRQIRKLQESGLYAKNDIRTTKYTALSFLPKNLFEQFHRFANIYFVFIILLNFVPEISAIQPFVSMIPVIGILAVQAVKDLIEDYGRRRNDAEINGNKCDFYSSSDNKYHKTKWSKLEVGDIVRVTCNQIIPADLLLLHSSDEHGVCFIETSNIDGESNLKQRVVIKREDQHAHKEEFHPEMFRSIIECQTPNNEIYKFHGNIIPPDGSDKVPVNNGNLLLRGCVIRNTDYVEGIVVYAGHETKAMLNNNGPRYKRSKLERRMNKDVIFCVILLVIMCLIGSIGNSVWTSAKNAQNQTELFLPKDADGNELDPALSGFYMFWTMVILLQVLIPISLYVSIEVVKWAQVYMINNDVDLYHEESNTPMICRALNIPEDLGQIQFVFSDKTGTLTENKMVFRRCTVGGQDYPHAANAARIENAEPTPAEMHPNPSRSDSLRKKAIKEKRDLDFERYVSTHNNRPKSGGHVSTLSNHQNGGTDLMVAGATDFEFSRSAPNSPMPSRRSKRVSMKRPASHHRRNISIVSAREIMATNADDDDADDDDGEYDEVVDGNHAAHHHRDDVSEDSTIEMETDITPDPVLYRHLTSIPFKMMTSAGGDLEFRMSRERSRVFDFFVNLAICNTVVISNNGGGSETPSNGDANSSTAEFVPATRKFGAKKRILDFMPKLSPVASTPTIDFDAGIAGTVAPRIDIGGTGDVLTVPPIDGAAKMADLPKMEDEAPVSYEAESPDEAALVYAARSYGCSLMHRSVKGQRETVTVELPGAHRIVFQVMHTLQFDSARKRMSVVVRDLRTKQIIVYCKGADSAILSRLAKVDDPVEDLQKANYGGDLSGLMSNSQEVVNQTKKALNNYAHQGLRTLCMAKRVLSESEYQEWTTNHAKAESSLENREEKLMDSYDKIETDFQLLGATGIEDRLQEGVPDTIESLRQAGIQVWVVTGDKQETAVNIGYSCRLIHQNDEVIILSSETKEAFVDLLDASIRAQEAKRGRIKSVSTKKPSPFNLIASPTYTAIDDQDNPALVLVIDGKTLGFALEREQQKKFVRLARICRSVLCCRATPLQKGEVVKLIREELQVMTLAIGDGANDVSMIQVADVGIGLSGQEGMQAVMSSDYAIAQFRFLRKLLLVHGHWNYARLASLVLYFFYKNAAFAFLIFWFQLICGFSGGNMIEQMYLLLFNLTITGFPPLVNGVFDKDLKCDTLLRKPHLYKQGINDEVYKPRTFWVNIIDAIYQSLVIFLFIMFAYYDSDVGLIEWGTVVTTAAVFVILLHLAIETKTWTWIHWAGQLGSLLGYFAFALIYNIVCPACLPPSNPYFIMERVIQTPKFWFATLLATVVALLPRFMVRSLQTDFFPTESQRERVMERSKSARMTRRKSSPVVSPSRADPAPTTRDSAAITYENPTYRRDHDRPTPPASSSSSSSSSAAPKRPDELFITSPSRQNHHLSTPDLTTAAPFYAKTSGGGEMITSGGVENANYEPDSPPTSATPSNGEEGEQRRDQDNGELEVVVRQPRRPHTVQTSRDLDAETGADSQEEVPPPATEAWVNADAGDGRKGSPSTDGDSQQQQQRRRARSTSQRADL